MIYLKHSRVFQKLDIYGVEKLPVKCIIMQLYGVFTEILNFGQKIEFHFSHIRIALEL